MKKGFITLEYVVIAVVVLAFAGVALYITVPRLQRAPGFVEQFFPEKCPETGLTRDEYLNAIVEKLSAQPLQAKEALDIHFEMLGCFPDFELSQDLRKFTIAALRPQLKTLAEQGTAKAFDEIITLYDKSKTIGTARDWETEELVIVARALYWQGRKGESRDQTLQEVQGITAFALTKQKTVSQEAELQYLQTILAPYEARAGKVQQFVNRFKDSQDALIKLYVGLAHDYLGNEAMSNQALEAVRTAPNRFVADTAHFYLGISYLVTKEHSKADSAYQYLLDQQDSLYRHAAAAQYATIPEAERKYKNCAQNTLVQENAKCICTFKDTAFLLPESFWKYCCTGRVSDEPCECKDNPYQEQCALCQAFKYRSSSEGCAQYPNEQLCRKDPCKFTAAGLGYYNACIWENNKCSSLK